MWGFFYRDWEFRAFPLDSLFVLHLFLEGNVEVRWKTPLRNHWLGWIKNRFRMPWNSWKTAAPRCQYSWPSYTLLRAGKSSAALLRKVVGARVKGTIGDLTARSVGEAVTAALTAVLNTGLSNRYFFTAIVFAFLFSVSDALFLVHNVLQFSTFSLMNKIWRVHRSQTNPSYTQQSSNCVWLIVRIHCIAYWVWTP